VQNAPSCRSRRPVALFAQSSIAQAIDSITNPHLNGDYGTIIALPDATFGLAVQLAQSSMALLQTSIGSEKKNSFINLLATVRATKCQLTVEITKPAIRAFDISSE
jgi:hypothetical protein